MNKLLYILTLFFNCAAAQTGLFINGADASLFVSPNSFLSVDGDFRNDKCHPVGQVRFNGSLYLAGSLINNDSLIFSAATSTLSKNSRIIFNTPTSFLPSAIIGGTVVPKFWEVELDKGIGSSITLFNTISSSDTVTFKSGYIYMNGYKWELKDPVGAVSVLNHPWIKNERNGCQFIAFGLNDTGVVRYNTIYSTSVGINPANIGLEIGGLVNIGSPLTVIRGFKNQNYAAKSSILRYFDVYSTNHRLVNNTIQIRYFNTELSYFTPGFLNVASLKLYGSHNSDMDWSPLSSGIQTNPIILPANFNGVMTASLSDLRQINMNLDSNNIRVTLADPNCLNPPYTSFTADTLHICAGGSQIIDAGNNSSIPNSSLRYKWNTSSPVYTRTITVSPGTVFQKLIVNLLDARGCAAKDSIIIAPSAPFPQITYFNHLNSCLGDSVTIKDTVTIQSGSYTSNWFYSDGSSSTGNKILFRKKFNAAGVYSLQLITTSNYGCVSSRIDSNIIVYSPPSTAFTSSFNCGNGLRDFTSTSVSNHSTMVINNNSWTFGALGNTMTSLSSISYSFPLAGTYNVKLKSSTNFGCKDSITIPVTIYPRNTASFSKGNVCLGDTVFLTNNSSCNTGNCTYRWDLGNGDQDSTFNKKVVYSTSGLFIVKQIISNPNTCKDSVSIPIFINARPSVNFTASSFSNCLNETFYFTNTSTISAGAISGYTWTYGNGNTNNTTNGLSSYSLANDYYVTLLARSDSGCTKNTGVAIAVKPQPSAQYVTSNVCAGTPNLFVSSSSGSGLSHVWSYGNSVTTGTLNGNTHTYTYPIPGNYSTQLIVFSSDGCSDTATYNHIVYALPSISLGGTVSTCGVSYSMNANNAGSTFLWLPLNETSQTCTVTSSGIYQVVITSTANCTSSETVQVILNSLVIPNLGPDTAFCGKAILDAGYPGSNFQWNTNQSTQIITPSVSGIYAVNVIDQNGCSGSDSIQIVIKPSPTISCGPDLTLCRSKGGYVHTASASDPNIQWSSGANTFSLSVQNSGLLWASTTASNGCTARDSINITFLNTPVIDLGPDKSSCEELVVDAKNFGCNFLWNTGWTGQNLNVSSTGLYIVNVTNTLSGCVAKDTIILEIHPKIIVNLGNDTSVCNNSGFRLRSEKNKGQAFLWTDGSTQESLAVISSGVYGVTITGSGGCSESDYINVIVKNAPRFKFGSYLKYLCGLQDLIVSGPKNYQCIWTTAEGEKFEKAEISVNKTGKYHLSVKQSGCESRDSILVSRTTNTIQASFLASSQDTVNRAVQFINLSSPNPVTQIWEFGDGLSSTEKNPLHTFVIPHDYSVGLEVSNGFCTDKLTKSLNVLFRESVENRLKQNRKLELVTINVFPNPLSESTRIQIELSDLAKIRIQLLDLNAKVIAERKFENLQYADHTMNLDGLCKGMYIFDIYASSEKGNVWKKIKIIKSE